jgi:fermentation-respiration switch protein FrsA (DUF1100 family)
MSGAALPGFTTPPSGAPPLLAIQGTEDPLNAPGTTSSYFAHMQRPKFLLWLLGAGHLEPYTTNDRWAPTIRRTTTQFLDRYLRAGSLRALENAGTRPGVARIVLEP